METDQFFKDFVRIARQRYGSRHKNIDIAKKDKKFMKWYREYVARGCGIVG